MDPQRLSYFGPLTRVLLFLLLMCFLVGCASRPEIVRLYGEEHLPADQVAYLVGDRESLMLHSVDGTRSPSGRKGFGSSWDGTYSLEVLPGEHTLTVSLYLRTTSRELGNRFSTYETHYEISSLENVDITLSLQPRHTYLLTSEWDFDSQIWFPMVIDQTTDQTVFKEGPYPFKKFQVGDFFKSPGSALRR